MITFARFVPFLCIALALSTVIADPPAPGAADDAKTEQQLSQDLHNILHKQQIHSTLLKKLVDAEVQNFQETQPKKTDGPGKLAAADAAQRAADEELLKSAGLKSEPADLLEFFRKRTLPAGERPRIDAVVRELGSVSYREREQAMHVLIGKGSMILAILKDAIKDDDPEVSCRAEKCCNRIRQDDVAGNISAAAVRLLGRRRPDGAVEALFAYLPTAQSIGIVDDVRDALVNLAQDDGKAGAFFVKELRPSSPWRTIAAEVLCKAGLGEHKEAVRKLLQDADLQVRLRVARSLALNGDSAAVPILIDLLPMVSFEQAYQIDDILYRIAGGRNPPKFSVGRDEPTRKKSQAAWLAWWQKEGKNVDLAKLSETPVPELGHTMVVLLDESRVAELDKDNQQQWSVGNLNFPLDAQVLPEGRVLVAEYHAQLVSERNLKGEILWKKTIAAPLVAQRLTNGHTFIATDSQFVEFDREDKEVVNIAMNGERVMKALKLPSGEIVCMVSTSDQFDARILRLDATGKELSSFPIELGARLFGGRIHALPNGNVLVPHNGENKVVEYDAHGKSVWEIAVVQPIAAFRLANGNTLVTSMQPTRGAVEFTRAGTEVWTFRAPTRVTRAMRR